MPKFEYSKKSTVLKNGHTIETTTIKAPNPKSLISYDYLTQVIDKLQENGVDINKLRIFGSNRINAFTIKSENEEYDPHYLENKPKIEAEKLDGFHAISIVSVQ